MKTESKKILVSIDEETFKKLLQKLADERSTDPYLTVAGYCRQILTSYVEE